MKVEKVILKSKKFSNIKSWISSVADGFICGG